MSELKDRVEDMLHFRHRAIEAAKLIRDMQERIKELEIQEEKSKARIEELEIIIQTACIIGWREEELPDAKNMILGTAIDLVTRNLNKAKPFQQTPGAKYWHRIRELEEENAQLKERLLTKENG